jgi:hypothetical protein
MTFIEFAFLPQNIPFTAALTAILIALFVEFTLTLVGVGIGDLLDGMMPHFDHATPLSWFGFGKVPAFIILLSFALSFGFSGWAIQGLSIGLGMPLLNPWLASFAAIFPAFPVTARLSRILARVIPKDETFVGTKDDVVGRIGVIMQGTARRDLPAQCKVSDGHGGSFYLQAVPNDGVDPIPEGTSVLVVSRTSDDNFAVVPFN